MMYNFALHALSTYVLWYSACITRIMQDTLQSTNDNPQVVVVSVFVDLMCREGILDSAGAFQPIIDGV